MNKSKLAAAVLTLTLGVGTVVIDSGYFLSTPILARAATTKTSATQATNQTDFDWTYDDTNNTATLVRMNVWAGLGDNSSSVVIPDTVTHNDKQYKVTQIGNQAFANQDHMTSVVLPKFLKSIGDQAFVYTHELMNVDFSQATELQTIGDEAFSALNQTSPITLPDSLISIGQRAFDYAKTSEITLGKNTKLIGSGAFLGMDNLTKVVLNSKLEEIGSQAFIYDAKLTDVNWDNATSLTQIDDGAFEYSGISGSISFGNQLKTIGSQAFAGDKVTALTFPDSLQTIGPSAFAYNKIAGKLSIPKNVTTVGTQAFVGNLISDVEIAGTPTVGPDAFSYNKIVKLNGSTTKLPDSGAIGQTATITAEQPTLKINNLFGVNINSKTESNLVLSDLTNNVTYDSSTGTFNIPAGVKQFSFKWTLKDGTDTIYSGNYTVFREIPKIAAHSSTIYIGDPWNAKDNYDGNAFDKMKVTIKNSSGNVVSDIDTSQVGQYSVTYSYGNDATTITVDVVKKQMTYSLTGTQTVDYNGSLQQPTPSNYTIHLSGTDQKYTLKAGDIEFDPKEQNPGINPGTYGVVLTKQGQDAINALYGSKYNVTETTSNATFTIVKATVTASLSDGTKTYDGQTVSQSNWKPTLTIKSGNNDVASMTLNPDEYSVRDDNSAIGTYEITLNEAGKTAIQSKYPYYTFTNLEDVKTTYTITSAKTTSTLTKGTKVYDGQTISQGNWKPTLTLKDSKGETIDTLTLSYGQYTLSQDGANVGTYTVNLSGSEITAIKNKWKNYTFDDLSSVSSTFTITKKALTATLSGGSKTYDGRTVSDTFTPTLTLDNGQTNIATINLNNTQYQVENDSSAPGQYKITLTKAEAQAIQTDSRYSNYDLSAVSSVQSTYTITPVKSLTATLSSGTKVYDGRKVSESGFTPTLTILNGNSTVLTITLQSGEYDIAGDDSKVGSYKITIDKNEIRTLQQQYPQYDLSNLDTIHSTYTITGQPTTTTLSNGSKVYDGRRISESNYTPTLTLVSKDKDGKSVIVGTVLLRYGQYVAQTDGSAVGPYTITLSSDEIKALKDQYSNYDLGDLTKVTATYTITPQKATVATLSGGSKVYDGKKVSQSNFTPVLTLKNSTGDSFATVMLNQSEYTIQNDGSNVGSYKITLTSAEITAIKTTYPLYEFDDLSSVSSNFTITKQQGKAKLSGGTKVYDGKSVGNSNYQPVLTLLDASGKVVATIKLNKGQYTILNDSSAVGTYKVELTADKIATLNTKYQNYNFELSGVTATYTITSGGDSNGGGDKGGNVVPNTPDTPTTPTTPVTPKGTPSVVSAKGAAVYAINKIGLYSSKNFSKTSRLTWYSKKPRIYRPMFVVTGYARSKAGVLRYKVRDVNHLSKTRGKTGYITASWKYIRPVYYASKHTTLTVINPRGVNAYKEANLTGKVKNYKQGSVLKVKKFVNHNLTTRYVLTNGDYVTGNRKLVKMGRHAVPKKVKAKGAINRYSNVGLTKKNHHYSAKTHKTFKVYGFDYSNGHNLKRHGTLRYRVAGGYITGNTKLVRIIK